MEAEVLKRYISCHSRVGRNIHCIDSICCSPGAIRHELIPYSICTKS